MKINSKIDEIMNNFNKTKETSEQTKNELKMKLRPYLDNPYFSKDLDTFGEKNEYS